MKFKLGSTLLISARIALIPVTPNAATGDQLREQEAMKMLTTKKRRFDAEFVSQFNKDGKYTFAHGSDVEKALIVLLNTDEIGSIIREPLKKQQLSVQIYLIKPALVTATN